MWLSPFKPVATSVDFVRQKSADEGWRFALGRRL